MDNPEIGRSVLADGIPTNYHEAGEGPPVLLLHGSGPGVSAWANWRLNLEPLAARHRVLAPDLVGFGYTERPPGVAYNLDTWVSHVLSFADAVGIDTFSVVGNSFGGALALAIATSHPERVDRLVLMGAVGISFPLTEGLDAVWGYEPSIENMAALLRLFAYDPSLVGDELAELRYRASIRPGIQEAYRSMFPAPRQRWIEALATPEEEIASLAHPALVIHGREDRVIPPDVGRRLFELIPDAELHMFGRCGHWTQIEHRDRFNGLVSEFLAG